MYNCNLLLPALQINASLDYVARLLVAFNYCSIIFCYSICCFYCSLLLADCLVIAQAPPGIIILVEIPFLHECCAP